MKELRRLRSTSPNPLTRELLAAGRNEGPSRDARRNAAIAIGLAATATTTATAGGAAAGTATGTAAASKWLGGLGLLKLVGATVVSGAVVVGVAHEANKANQASHLASVLPPAMNAAMSARAPTAAARVKSPESPQPLPLATPPIEERKETPPPSAETAGVASAFPPPMRPLPFPPVARGASPAASPVHGVEDATLREEVERLDRVRASLAAGRSAVGLAELDAYDRAFPNGALGDEAELLRIETLAQMGALAAARSRAERLLARDEHGPHARRVRALLASLPRDGSAH